MRHAYRGLRAGYPELVSGFDQWFERPLNNAHLASVGAYHQLVPGFEALLRAVDGDLPAFYAEVARLARLPRASREAELARRAGSTVAPVAGG